MGTSCNIFVELEGGKHIGVYCHYDGYLEHMLPELHAVDYDTLYGIILKAGTSGGVRILNERKAAKHIPAGTEYLDDTYTEYFFDPDDRTYATNFAYIKKLNGEVFYKKGASAPWKNASKSGPFIQ